MRIAIVHHWFVTRGGGERVAEMIAALFPDADIFTLIARPQGLPASLQRRNIRSSFLQWIPFAKNYHRHFLPFYPTAIERLSLGGYDLVLSSDSGPVKGIRLKAGAVHICYCHTPMRYLWGVEGISSMGGIASLAFRIFAPRVRRWDAKASRGVTYFLANSDHIAKRVAKVYGRDADVIAPPISVERSVAVADIRPEDSYLCAGRLVPYKRTELVIQACMRLGRKLRIVGDGPELRRLRKVAAGDPNIVFTGEVPDEALWQEYARCRALLFVAEEDFGMVPLEAQACGRPVIAYGAGGSLETVRGTGPKATGMYFPEQTVKSVMDAILRWKGELEKRFQPQDARDWADRFQGSVFLVKYRAFVVQHAPEAASQAATVEDALRRVK